MPIGGQPAIEDVAPEPLRLGQVEVDGEIARLLAVEEHEKMESSNKTTIDNQSTELSGIPKANMDSTPGEEVGKSTGTYLLGIPANNGAPKTKPPADVQSDDTHARKQKPSSPRMFQLKRVPMVHSKVNCTDFGEDPQRTDPTDVRFVVLLSIVWKV